METVEVHDAEQLREVIGRRPTPQIRLAIRSLEHAEASVWEERLNAAFGSCGCTEGTVGMIGSLAASFSAIMLGRRLSAAAAASVVVSTTVGGALVGKVAGRARGRRQGLRVASELIGRLEREMTPADADSDRVVS